MFSAFTEEIDDVDAAIDEILSQLDLEQNLLKNSVGILHCYHEFIDSGVVKTLSEKLPFNIIGITVPYICMYGKASSMGLMLNILTGDDVEFVTGISDPIDIGGGNLYRAMDDLCEGITKKLKSDEKPAMLMAFGPFMHVLRINADDFVNNISKSFPNTPVFGGFSYSEEIDYSKCFMLYNGESYENVTGLIALTGNVEPSFLTISVPEKNIVGELATATKSTGNTLHTINGIPVEDYAISIGLTEQKGELEKLYTTPMITKLDDGSTIVRVCIGGDGQGGAIMGGHVHEGSKIGFTMLELSDTISTSSEIAKKAMEMINGRNIIIYTCMARLDFLGSTQREMEADTMCNIIGDSANFYIAYTGGEIFPSLLPDGKFANHLQNFSVVICML